MLKKLLLLAALLWTGGLSAAAPTQAVFDVKNMTCAACGVTIQTALRRVPGVSQSHVDEKSSTVTVQYDSKRTTASALEKVISESGFPAKVRSAGG